MGITRPPPTTREPGSQSQHRPGRQENQRSLENSSNGDHGTAMIKDRVSAFLREVPGSKEGRKYQRWSLFLWRGKGHNQDVQRTGWHGAQARGCRTNSRVRVSFLGCTYSPGFQVGMFYWTEGYYNQRKQHLWSDCVTRILSLQYLFNPRPSFHAHQHSPGLGPHLGNQTSGNQKPSHCQSQGPVWCPHCCRHHSFIF